MSADSSMAKAKSRNAPVHNLVLERAGMIPVGDTYAPEAPTYMEDTGIHPDVLADLVLRLAFTIPTFTTERVANHLCLPSAITAELLKKLREDKLIENLGASGPLDYRYAITDAGRERARRLIEVTSYTDAAPVSLAMYRQILEAQLQAAPVVSPEAVYDAISHLVLPEDALQIASLAGSSPRTLFIFGPAGNGKTTLGHLLHNAMEGYLWIPYCIGIDAGIIRVYDPNFHEIAEPELTPDEAPRVDRRWIRIKRPFIVAGGEMTTESMDLGYSPALGYYEAPLHLKANGGTFLLDDLGFQRNTPSELLSRWIFPLENGLDYLTLQTGQKIEVPFSQKLIVSTNLDPDKVMSPAFLRRMGYRLYLGDPSPADYIQIFRNYAAQFNVAVPSSVMEWILEKYESENRPLRGCEPRDLIERARDFCRFRGQELELTEDIMQLAWVGYFGNNGVRRKDAPFRHPED
jgi:hypothetical protein